MASLVTHKGKGEKTHYHVAFRYSGKRFLRSLDTTDDKKARQALANIRETLQLIAEGRLTSRTDADDLWAFVQSGGRVEAEQTLTDEKTLGSIIAEYTDTCPEGNKEANSIATEKTQFKKFLRIIGSKTPLARIDVAEIEAFIKQRQKEKGLHGRKVKAATIRKELATFSQMWNFARNRGYVTSPINPVKAKRKTKPDAEMPFQTWLEIEKEIKRHPNTDGTRKGNSLVVPFSGRGANHRSASNTSISPPLLSSPSPVAVVPK